jgi:hypothetical protein
MDDHIGQGHELEPFVGLLRGISPEVHDHAVYTAHLEGEKAGWKNACAYLETELRENKRQFGRRLEDRIYREMRARRRAFWIDNMHFAAILATFITACYLMTRVG